MVPLACQAICPILLFFSMLFCPESPRWLASNDQWDRASNVLADVRKLPIEHPYIQQELLELRTQLDDEKAVMQGAGFWELQKECWTIPTNRNRALITILMLTFNQWSGVSVLPQYSQAYSFPFTRQQANTESRSRPAQSTTTLPLSSEISDFPAQAPHSSHKASMVSTRSSPA
jgi:hypothetical protein